jgi:hypothetical protein
MGTVLRRWTFRLHPLPSAAVSAALSRGNAPLAFMDVGVGFVDRAAVVAVGFSQDLWVIHTSICITPETISTFDTNRIPKQAKTIKKMNTHRTT